MEKKDKYEVVRIEATDTHLEDYRQCFENNNSPRKIENLKWLHYENLAGTNIIYYAIDKNKGNVSAIYTVLPVFIKIKDQIFLSAQSIDTITVADHRGKGLFVKTAQKLYDTIAGEQYKLVYGFPNQNSSPGLFNKLGWTSFGEVPFMIKPLRLSYFVKKLSRTKKINGEPAESNHHFPSPEGVDVDNNIQIRRIYEYSSEYDKLWENVSKGIIVCVNRNSEYMNWRYIRKPDGNYYNYGIYENNALVGIIVFTIKNKHGGRVGYLMEQLFFAEKAWLGKKLLKFANKLIKKEKADVILAWALKSHFSHKAYLNCGYFFFPEKLRPQKLYFGVKALDPLSKDVILDKGNWYISYSDSDTV